MKHAKDARSGRSKNGHPRRSHGMNRAARAIRVAREQRERRALNWEDIEDDDQD